MSKETLAILGAGLLSGLMYLSALTGLPGAVILFNLAQLPLFLAGLGLGATASAFSAIAGTVAAGLIGGSLAAVIYALVNAAPAVLVTRRALLSKATADGGLEWYPPGLLVAWLTGLGAALFAVAAILFSGAEGGLEAYVRAAVAQALEQLAIDQDPARIAAFAEAAAPYVPGVVVATWMIVVTVNGALAQGVLARFGRALRPSPDIAALELPRWMTVALAVAALLAWFGDGALGFIGWNMVIILAVPFFFAGLGVVHAVVRRIKGGPMILAMFYLFLIVFGWPVVLVAGLGLTDQWAGFRRYLRAKDSGKEDE
ncbi:MAG: DUF2232 domain-containing protein [Alphaproteobacteria bacterium]